ncbi:hypothetical protein RRX38_13990 [Pseudomonas sp. DTU_2021_1001937_2_SI_NGA_ILE_001]|uniref:hypothetical protein n=1 Tax=Pseudomonas sp. DTU_2021_1001937_2_SI_NGA_ILE_001 TaxID=3077589 RepID=UPI0025FEA40B|nr:hypothetical protein [Pseudomonas sp. DTU_2021_1001937_2_SI_NGA_ILE_001]WNW12207.1 hypothetical protein RRX38_13990 [Pseudomonas sp. DTU_2021_1001937_2_SI_NGA_ILE_001]
MEEFHHHFSQLPDFLQHEVSALVEHTPGLPGSHVVDRHRIAAEQLAHRKYAELAPQDIADARQFLGNQPYTKPGIEHYLHHRNQGITGIGLLPSIQNAHFVLESTRFLNEFAQRVAPIVGRLRHEEHLAAVRHAEEMARQHAERLAAEAARRLAEQQAEEAARELARRQVEEARQRARLELEDSRQRAQREQEEATRLPALHQAEEQARLEAARLGANTSISGALGPQASAVVDIAYATLKNSIEQAISAFQQTLGGHVDLTQDAPFQALLRRAATPT